MTHRLAGHRNGTAARAAARPPAVAGSGLLLRDRGQRSDIAAVAVDVVVAVRGEHSADSLIKTGAVSRLRIMVGLAWAIGSGLAGSPFMLEVVDILL